MLILNSICSSEMLAPKTPRFFETPRYYFILPGFHVELHPNSTLFFFLLTLLQIQVSDNFHGRMKHNSICSSLVAVYDNEPFIMVAKEHLVRRSSRREEMLFRVSLVLVSQIPSSSSEILLGLV